MSAAVQNHPKVKFDSTINLGHILTFIGFMATGLGMYMSLDKRVTVNELRATQHEIDLKRLEENDKAITEVIRSEVRGVRDEIRELRKELTNGTNTGRTR